MSTRDQFERPEPSMATFRNTSRWPVFLGIDARAVVLLFVSLIIHFLFLPALLYLALSIYAGVKGMRVERLLRYWVARMTGRYVHAHSIRRQRGVRMLPALAVLAMVGAGLPPAHADYQVMAPAATGASSSMTGDAGAGSNPNAAPAAGVPYKDPKIVGFGNNVPLSVALEQIVPKGYDISYTTPTLRSQAVSWASQGDLIATLDTLAGTSGANMALDLDHKTLVVSPAASSAGALKLLGQYTPNYTASATSHRWMLHRGEMLSKALARWTASQGWSLRWNLHDDYPISADATYTGTMFQAVSQLVNDYRAAGQMTQDEAVFKRGNKVLVFRPWNRFTKGDPNTSASMSVGATQE